jgi:transposase InsO family protein
MVVHKHTKLTPRQRKALAYDHFVGKARKVELMAKYGISYPTVQKILARAKHGDFTVHKSINRRYQCLEYGLKRLSKVSARIEAKLKKQARRYEKSYPGELLHLDTKRLPWLKGEGKRYESEREYLFVAIDDFSRELYAGIYPDKSSWSAASFLKSVLRECPYTIERILTDNGTEYKGRYGEHDFMRTCGEAGIKQSFTRVRTPQTNGKAERVIRTLMEQWYANERFTSHRQRKQSLARFVNYYNCVKPHKGIDNQTPLERLCEYFYPTKRLHVLLKDAEMHGV